MPALVLIVGGLVAIAVGSAFAVYRRSGSDAWSREYDAEGTGLTIELAVLTLVVAAGVAISIIMTDSFRTLFLEGAWHSYPYLAAAFVVTLGVSIYMVAVAPSILARKQSVESTHVRRQCLLPYLAYTPFAVVLWVGLVLPVLALLAVSFHSDHRNLVATQRNLESSGALVLARADREPEAAPEHVAIYGLEYGAAVDTVQHTVSRYLWVIGVFMIFLLVILNTRITSVYTEEAQDIFKWLMWGLLLVAVGICLFGLTRYQAMRDLAMTTHERIVSSASSKGQLELVVATKGALLELRKDGPAVFLSKAVLGGIWLMVFGYGLQIVLAKVTHRSAVDVIFPRSVARFLNGFLLGGEEQQAPLR